jgi:hypothetical protein
VCSACKTDLVELRGLPKAPFDNSKTRIAREKDLEDQILNYEQTILQISHECSAYKDTADQLEAEAEKQQETIMKLQKMCHLYETLHLFTQQTLGKTLALINSSDSELRPVSTSNRKRRRLSKEEKTDTESE